MNFVAEHARNGTAIFRIACLTMQKNEGDMLRCWIEYHSSLFGMTNLFVFDNGSDDKYTNDILSVYESCGLNVMRSFPSKDDFEQKGRIIANTIISLDETNPFDFYFPVDTDEFICCEIDGKIRLDRTAIEQELTLHKNDKRVLRICASYEANPIEEDFYFRNTVQRKSFFSQGACKSLDIGFHQASSVLGEEHVRTGIAHIHFHDKSFHFWRERAVRKLEGRVKSFDVEDLKAHRGRGEHLSRALLGGEQGYYERHRNKTNAILLPEIRCKFSEIGVYDYLRKMMDFEHENKRNEESGLSQMSESAEEIDRVLAEFETPDDLFRAAKSLESTGLVDRYLQYLSFGSNKFPFALDKFGHPLFAKESVRALLSLGRFADAFKKAKAEKLSLAEHSILFARAYQAAGNLEAARAWWIKTNETQPGHPECVRFFKDNPPVPAFSQTAARKVDLPHIRELLARFPNYKFKLAFDVGANVGQSIPALFGLSPVVEIHCFEPSPHSFSALKDKYGTDRRIVLNNVALSDRAGELLFSNRSTSTMNRAVAGGDGIPVRSDTIDSYVRKNGIEHIDYMKIDTEGHEIKVISGAMSTLPMTSFVEVEASMNPYNKYHTSFSDLSRIFFENGFYLFKIFEQTLEWGGGGIPILRRANLIFVNSAVIGEIPKDVIVA